MVSCSGLLIFRANRCGQSKLAHAIRTHHIKVTLHRQNTRMMLSTRYLLDDNIEATGSGYLDKVRSLNVGLVRGVDIVVILLGIQNLSLL